METTAFLLADIDKHWARKGSATDWNGRIGDNRNMGEMFAVCLHIITFSQHNLFWFTTLNVTAWTSDSWHSGWMMMVRFPRIVLLCRSVNVATCYDHDIGTRLVPMWWSTPTLSGMATSCKRLPAVARIAANWLRCCGCFHF